MKWSSDTKPRPGDSEIAERMAARYADRVAIREQSRLTALGHTDATLEPARLSTVFATPIVRIVANGKAAFLSLG